MPGHPYIEHMYDISLPYNIKTIKCLYQQKLCWKNHLLVSIEHALRSHNDHRRWSTLREQLSTHQRNTVIFTDADNKIHHLRVSGMPEKEHLEIYRLLGVKDPLKRRHHLAGSRL